MQCNCDRFARGRVAGYAFFRKHCNHLFHINETNLNLAQKLSHAVATRHLNVFKAVLIYLFRLLLALGVGGLSTGPFCVEFTCSPCVHKDPNRKTCNRTLSCQSLTKMDSSLHLVPGCLKAPGGRTVRDGKIQIHGDLRLHVSSVAT